MSGTLFLTLKLTVDKIYSMTSIFFNYQKNFINKLNFSNNIAKTSSVEMKQILDTVNTD